MIKNEKENTMMLRGKKENSDKYNDSYNHNRGYKKIIQPISLKNQINKN